LTFATEFSDVFLKAEEFLAADVVFKDLVFRDKL